MKVNKEIDFRYAFCKAMGNQKDGVRYEISESNKVTETRFITIEKLCDEKSQIFTTGDLSFLDIENKVGFLGDINDVFIRVDRRRKYNKTYDRVESLLNDLYMWDPISSEQMDFILDNTDPMLVGANNNKIIQIYHSEINDESVYYTFSLPRGWGISTEISFIGIARLGEIDPLIEPKRPITTLFHKAQEDYEKYLENNEEN